METSYRFLLSQLDVDALVVFSFKVKASPIVLSTGWFTATKCQRLSMAYLTHVLYSVQPPLLFKLYMFSCLF